MNKITILADLKVNDLGVGGHLFYTQDKAKYPWLGAWMFKLEGEPLSSWVFIHYPESCTFEPGNFYKVKINLLIAEDIKPFFKTGNQFKIQAGILYDNQYWATGEILEILDEDTNKN